jgi:uncharacterized membrane protein
MVGVLYCLYVVTCCWVLVLVLVLVLILILELSLRQTDRQRVA